MTYFLIFSGVICAWAMLRLMGDERTRMLQDQEATLRAAKSEKNP
jgi:hypothetical protein